MTKSTISWHTKCILSASISKKHPFSPSEKHSLRAGGQWVVLPVNVAHGDFPIPQNLASLAPSSDQQSAIVGAIVRHLVSLETLHLKDLAEKREKRARNRHGLACGIVIPILGRSSTSLDRSNKLQQWCHFFGEKNNPETSMVFHHRAHHPYAPLSSTSPPSKGQYHLG